MKGCLSEEEIRNHWDECVPVLGGRQFALRAVSALNGSPFFIFSLTHTTLNPSLLPIT